MGFVLKNGLSKSLFQIITILIFIISTTFAQMSKFPLQDKNFNYKGASIITAPNNDLLFFWVSDLSLYQSRSTNNGSTWSDPILLGFAYDNYFSAADNINAFTSVSGRIFIIFYDYRYYSIYSDDNGNSWSSPLHFNFNITPRNGVLSESSIGKLF